ncbi:polysaccharide biosynthesis C-terminal domain-containing protein [uncultured Sunxiuqinia sp.]|uniref:lipopolysaccharide biosynthesis protein n=1 Tax=uncultured Sunxiuqinia sp. TaxID=1573825 RepID=UPI002605D666|nr:polysaccharide biosynthesis C-terminal domain-containing protein [uncultured Sunxiuqinia sp.]
MNSFKKLAGETAIYGMSSIVGRFINWWLVPYYSFIFLTSEYGVVTNLYSYMAFLLVFLSYGMETGFFRFASQAENKERAYSSALISLFGTSMGFLLVVLAFSKDIAAWIDYPDHPEYIQWVALIVVLDTLTAIPFAKLRIESKAVKFAVLKFVNIFIIIFLNIFFFSICPSLLKNNPESWVKLIYSPELGVGYVFISNLIASVISLILLVPEMIVKLQLDRRLLKEMVWYSFPILIVGVGGIMTQHIDKILLPKLLPESQEPMSQLGIYGANVKLAVILNMFIQAFRYAFEPFFFSQVKSEDNKRGYAIIMKYFVLFGLSIFLGICLYIDLVKLIVDAKYHSGLNVVPIILMANLFLGIYYTLSLWYKLTDKTRYGAYFSLAGAGISLILNILFIPQFGYMASAWAMLISFVAMVVLSYSFGQKYFPVNYPLKRIGLYFAAALLIYFAASLLNLTPSVWMYLIHTLLISLFLLLAFLLERKEIYRFLK